MLGTHLAKKQGLNPNDFISIGFVALVSGLVGCRLAFVFSQLDYYMQFPWQIFEVWRGGMIFYGGFFLGVAAIFIYMKIKRLPLDKSLDIFSIGLCIGQAFGRIGCLGAGCCHGSQCELPWSVHLDSELVDPALRGLPLHPVQIYESIGLFVLLLFLLYIWKNFKPGLVSIAYCALYAILRFTVEFFRGDSIRGFWFNSWLSTSQGIAIVILFLSVLAFFVLGRSRGGWRSRI